jgi:predicted Zn-dependent peptidase
MRDGIHAEIERIKKQDITDDELKMIKTRARADLIRGLADNQGLAYQLATAQARYGDWRELFGQVDRIERVSKADIRRIANKTFTVKNRTVGIIENVPPTAPPSQSGGAQ